jgi:hypothetical protein
LDLSKLPLVARVVHSGFIVPAYEQDQLEVRAINCGRSDTTTSNIHSIRDAVRARGGGCDAFLSLNDSNSINQQRLRTWCHKLTLLKDFVVRLVSTVLSRKYDGIEFPFDIGINENHIEFLNDMEALFLAIRQFHPSLLIGVTCHHSNFELVSKMFAPRLDAKGEQTYSNLQCDYVVLTGEGVHKNEDDCSLAAAVKFVLDAQSKNIFSTTSVYVSSDLCPSDEVGSIRRLMPDELSDLNVEDTCYDDGCEIESSSSDTPKSFGLKAESVTLKASWFRNLFVQSVGVCLLHADEDYDFRITRAAIEGSLTMLFASPTLPESARRRTPSGNSDFAIVTSTVQTVRYITTNDCPNCRINERQLKNGQTPFDHAWLLSHIETKACVREIRSQKGKAVRKKLTQPRGGNSMTSPRRR